MKNFSQKGITLWEVLIVIAIMAIMATIVLPGFAKIKKVQVLKSSTEQIVSIIGKARSQTIASLNSSSYGVHFETDKVIIFTGVNFFSEDPNNQEIILTAPATISEINFSDSSSEIYFYRLSGMPNVTGTITVSAPGLSSKTITISATGFASSN